MLTARDEWVRMRAVRSCRLTASTASPISVEGEMSHTRVATSAYVASAGSAPDSMPWSIAVSRSAMTDRETAVSTGMRLSTVRPVHSSTVTRDSVRTDSGGNSSPNTVVAKVRTAVVSPSSPRVAEVATGVIRPRGRARSASVRATGEVVLLWRWASTTRPSRRSSSATSVPCAPS